MHADVRILTIGSNVNYINMRSLFCFLLFFCFFSKITLVEQLSLFDGKRFKINLMTGLELIFQQILRKDGPGVMLRLVPCASLRST